MRKDAKNSIQVQNVSVQSYHQYRGAEVGTTFNGNYALDGFSKNLYFTSDRYKELSEVPTPIGFGLEIETESAFCFNDDQKAQIMRNIILTDFHHDYFKLQNDSSLNNGCECITQIATKEFIRNHYANFKAMFSKMATMQFSPKLNGSVNCGMHTNISIACFGKTEKAQAQHIAMLYRLLNHNYDVFCELFKRDRSTTFYASAMRDFDISFLKGIKSLDAFTNRDGDFSRGHAVCLNLAHVNEGKAARVEIRLPGGQDGYYSFRNTMECIFHLIDFINNRCSWSNIDDLNECFKGGNAYVYKRLLDVKDMTNKDFTSVCDKDNKPYELH